tara:strand:- start:143 stop:721 length:579 start_codon:yes stop_codon:yes gene_type:complete
MKKKIFLQLFLLLTIVIIIVFVFKIYFSNKNDEVNNPKLEKKNLNVINSDLITNVEYISEGSNGSKYRINSKFAEINPEKENLIYMKDVAAVINLKNSTPIKIYSKKAIYNKLNNDTKFYIDVLATYDQHSIKSDTLQLLLEENIIRIEENIFYKNLNTLLQADKVVIDIITKNSKIFMNNKSDKIEIINKN